MTRPGLSRKQLSVIDDMFAGDIDTEAVLTKHNVTHKLFNKWLYDENFMAEFTRRIDWLNLQSRVMIARCASLAAAKLVSLTDSQNQETKRKACLDIISRLQAKDNQPYTNKSDDSENAEIISPETASKLLEILASENNNQ